MRRAAILITLAMMVPYGAAASAEWVRVDATTLVDPVTGEVRHAPAVIPADTAPAEATPLIANRDGAAPVISPLSLEDGFVGNSTSDDAFPFDLATYAPGSVINLLPEANYPYDATITPDGNQIWFVGASGDGAIVIDRATNTIIERIAVSEYPISVAFSPDGTLAVIPSRDNEVLDLVDTATYTVTGSLPIPTGYLGAGNVALDPVSGNFYMVDWFDELLYVIAPDGSAILDDETIGDSLWQLVVAPAGDFVYVTDRGTDEVRKIATATLSQVDAYVVGDDPWGIDITLDGSTLVVACEDSGDAYVIDTATGNSTRISLAADADPRDVDILDETGLAYVCGGRVGTTDPIYVIEIATASVLDTFEGPGTNPNVIAVQAQMGGGGTGVGEDVVAAPARDLAAQPNPFNPRTTVTFVLERSVAGELAIYDLAGRPVQVLARGELAAGEHRHDWDGRDAAGRRLSSGVYLVRLEAEGVALHHKVVLAK